MLAALCQGEGGVKPTKATPPTITTGAVGGVTAACDRAASGFSIALVVFRQLLLLNPNQRLTQRAMMI